MINIVKNGKTITNTALVLAILLALEGCSQSVKGYYIPRLDPVINEKPIPIKIEPLVKEKPLPIIIKPIIEEKQPSIKIITQNTAFLFPFGSAMLTPEGKTELLHFANELKKSNNEIEILTISGYTDRLGNKTFNQNLSQKRAQNIADYLKLQGINVPMSVIGKGSSQSVSGECRGNFPINCLAADRRVEIKLEYKKGN